MMYRSIVTNRLQYTLEHITNFVCLLSKFLLLLLYINFETFQFRIQTSSLNFALKSEGKKSEC